MERFRDLRKLMESKDAIINRMSQLTDGQKKTAKEFFNKHNDFENEIDWNKWRTLTWDDLSEVIYKDRSTKSQMYRKVKSGIEGIVEGTDYEILAEGEFNGEHWIAYYPMTWLGSRTIASNSVPPSVEDGNGSAEWCISYQKGDSYWKDHSRHEGFLFFCGESIPTKKIAVSIEMCGYMKDANGFEYEYETSDGVKYNIWDYYDKKIELVSHDFSLPNDYEGLISKLYNKKHDGYHRDHRSDIFNAYDSDAVYAYDSLTNENWCFEEDRELEHFTDRYIGENIDTYETVKMLIQEKYLESFFWKCFDKFYNINTLSEGIKENEEGYENITPNDVVEYLETEGVKEWMRDIRYIDPTEFYDYAVGYGWVIEIDDYLFRNI